MAGQRRASRSGRQSQAPSSIPSLARNRTSLRIAIVISSCCAPCNVAVAVARPAESLLSQCACYVVTSTRPNGRPSTRYRIASAAAPIGKV